MTIDQIEMLEAIVLEGSMQKAARRLNKSQPSLSVGIRKMEDFYGLKIFSREQYRPQLTKEGEVFYKNALLVLESHRRLHRVASELVAGVEAEIRWAMDPLIPLERVRPMLDAAAEFHPSSHLTIFEEVLDGPLNAILEGRAEFAVGYCPPEKSHLVDKIEFGHVELVPVVVKGADTTGLPNILVSNSPGSAGQNLSSGNQWVVSSQLKKEELILGGYGWGSVPKETLRTYKDRLRRMRTQSQTDIRLEIFVMKNKEAVMGRVGQRIWETCL